jgi:hypothetical protein
MKTRAEKRQAKKIQANKEAKMQGKICLFSITLLIAVILYNVAANGITQNLITFGY